MKSRTIPVTIHPIFWLVAAVLGWMNSRTGMGTLLWVFVIFFSVLVHEYGHALTARFFGQNVRIQLVAMGGITTYQGKPLTFFQQFWITLNGPLFGFGLYLLASFFLSHGVTIESSLYMVCKITQIANLFWTIANLIPVLPLDGGQLLRIFLESNFGIAGVRATLLLGAILSLLLSLVCFLFQIFLVGALFFLFAFQSLEMWRKHKNATDPDRTPENIALFTDGERAYGDGKKEEALQKFRALLEKSPQGMLAAAAAQYLALIALQEHREEEAYELLVSRENLLSEEMRCTLHQLSAQFGNWALVAKLSQECYQIAPSQEMALRSARAFAHLSHPKEAGGWLQAARSFGPLDLDTLLQEEPFHQWKENEEFREFLS